MEFYDKLINDIVDIIIKSDKKKQEAYIKEDFERVLWFDIHKSYLEKFKRYLDMEKIYYEVTKDDSNFNKLNTELANECESKINDNESNLYSELKDILIKYKNQSIDKLTYYLGYYILIEDVVRFEYICAELRIGPYKKVKSIMENPQDFSASIIQQNLLKKSEQYKRISSKVKEKNKSIDNNIFIYGETMELAKEYKLGMDDVINLKDHLSPFEYNRLVFELSAYKLLDQNELKIIEYVDFSKPVTDPTIEQLASFLFSINDGDVEKIITKDLYPRFINAETANYLLRQYAKTSKNIIPHEEDIIKER